ncbi:hypothetical protein [Nocardia bhagyanarayanae]|uniref:Uncharacterized protein n=1 Tax=Nocardia bhagyanarayanae TaxID=1215925 RepID=A0A543F7N8_9NOCA|nr:hypothetical protein [Nocardia bhagyanarayanae]TQM29843.1 hypothetical protein FB390_1455 [Nocardia bhagyanarayanae]
MRQAFCAHFELPPSNWAALRIDSLNLIATDIVAGMYGWWKSFEHYSVAGSRPVAVSRDVDVVEAHARKNTTSYVKHPVIGRLDHSGWRLVFKLHARERVQAPQPEPYENARAGGRWGNMGEVPPPAETDIASIDLDAR